MDINEHVIIPGVGTRHLGEVIELCSHLAVTVKFILGCKKSNQVLKKSANELLKEVYMSQQCYDKYTQAIEEHINSNTPSIPELMAYDRLIHIINQGLCNDESEYPKIPLFPNDPNVTH